MDSGENQFSTNTPDPNIEYKLSKHEIISGYSAYSRVLQNAIVITSDFLKAFVSNQSKDTVLIDSTQSPLFTNNVKVGFIIAKKKIKKAVLRNRIRRLLREAYRLNKHSLGVVQNNAGIIFSLTEIGYDHFLKNENEKLEFMDKEIKRLLEKIKRRLNK